MNPPLNTPTPGPGPLRTGTTAKVLDGRRNQIWILAVFVIVLVLLVRACSNHENKYEHIAREFNQSIQNNDYNAVARLENVETAANMRRASFGHAVDDIAPLGKIRRVHEVTTSDAAPRVHDFDVTFDNATVKEHFTFDPQDKVFRFDFARPQRTK